MIKYTERFFAKFFDQWRLGHEDARRRIEEVDTPNYCVQRYTVRAQIGLGNHYHQVTEYFYFAAGVGTIYLIPTVNGVPDFDKKWKVDVVPGSTLEVAPNTIHLFVMEPGAVFFCHSPCSFADKWNATTNHPISPW